MRFSIASKLNLMISGVVLLLGIIVGTFLIMYETEKQGLIIDERADLIIRNLAYNSEFGVLVNDQDGLTKLLGGVTQDDDVIYVAIKNNKAQVLAEKKTDHPNLGAIKSYKHSINTIPINSSFYEFDAFANPETSIEEPQAEEIIGEVELHLSSDNYEKELQKTKYLLVAVILGMVFFNMSLASFVVSRIVRKPLKKLSEDIQVIGSGNLNHRIVVTADDEIGDVGTVFNSMTSELSKTVISKSYVDNIILSMMDMLVVTNTSNIMTMINPSICSLLGYEKQELIDKPVSILFKKVQGGENQPFSSKELENRGGESFFIRKSGEKVPVLFSASKLIEGDKEIGMVIVARDITETKQAQQELQDAFSKLKSTQENLLNAERLAAVGETSGRVAHEVLNPITGIFSRIEHNINDWKEFDEIMTNNKEIISDWFKEYKSGTFNEYLSTREEDGKTYGDEDFELLIELNKNTEIFKEKREKDLHFVHKQLQRVIKIINSLRESARTQRAVVPVNLCQSVAESVEVLEDSMQKRHIKLIRKFPDHPPMVMADENEMIQVFTNMLRNSMQSIEEKKFKHGAIHITMELKSDHLQIRLQDNGSGIAPENQGSIFDFDFTTKSRDKGTGLGLGICRRFVRENGGELILEYSRPTEGTGFLITMPTQLQSPKRELS